MCQIMMKLKDIESRPVSKSFDNYDKISVAIDNIGKILLNNNSVVISPENRQKIIEAIHAVYKKTNKYR